MKSFEIIRDKDTTIKVMVNEQLAITVFMRHIPMGTILLKPEELKTIYNEVCKEL